ncbi:unnamed protein product [Zymoseptoria tritici ST99CH_3D1]|nr:unnamed protein product [Zymoseptoria tritici ST99CH_3D1]
MHATLPRPVPAWAVPPREEQSALIKTTPTSSSVGLLQPLASKTSRAARAQRANDHPNRANNNKRTARHWDAPPSPTKRIKLIDYDDLESSRSSPPLPEQSSKFVEFDDLAIRTGGVGNDDSEVTCFFWYHGTCSRSMDEKNGFKCHFKHGLTEPPSMVQPPPKYVHRTQCALDWCPGDAREPPSRKDSRLATLDQDEPTAEVKPATPTAVAVVATPKEDWFLAGFD